MSASGTSTFDEAGYRAEQRDDWDAAGAEIIEYVDDLESGLGVVSRRLVELAGLRSGQTVLDLGTGYGEPALGAARAVGPHGRVVGVDISPVMIEVARRRARGLAGVDFEVAEFGAVARADGSVDAVVSRFALMLATDRAEVFGRCARMLVPGGVLAASVWGPPAANLFVTGLAALTRELDLPQPPPGQPGAFALSEPGLLAGELRAAGFDEVDVEELVVPFRFAGADRYAGLLRTVMPRRLRRLAVERLGSEDALRELLARSVAPRLEPDGTLPLPSLAYVVRARTPA